MTITLRLSDIQLDSHCRRALNDISLAVAKCKKIVVVTGAGISCSSGIPDFRSSDGLYNLVKQKYPEVVLKGRDLFDASLFRDPTSTAVFYTFISQLKRSIDASEPTPTHHFIKTLDTKKKLLRSYTQNIDGLEERVGLQNSGGRAQSSNGKGKSKLPIRQCRNIQLHGDIHRVRCRSCSAEYSCNEEHLEFFEQGVSPDCPECLQRCRAREARSARAIRVGSLRPAIVLYDEPHPLGDDIGSVQGADITRKPDMLVIMGTSLKVHGLKKLVKEFAKAVHSHTTPASSKAKGWAGKVIFVNKTAPGSEWGDIIDYHISGETDEWSEKVIEDWKKMRPVDWEVQQTLVANGSDVSMSFKAVKNVAAVRTGKAEIKEVKKKPHPGEENVPPTSPSSNDMILSTPDKLHFLPIPKASPSSPSKRNRTQSHYNDLESSPSKRKSSGKHRLEPESRGLLFGNSTNNRLEDDALDFLADLSMQSPPKPKAVKRVPSVKVDVPRTVSPVPVKLCSQASRRKVTVLG